MQPTRSSRVQSTSKLAMKSTSISVLENILEDNSEKTMIVINKETMEETDDTIEDLNYQSPLYRHEDGTYSKEKVLMKKLKKLKVTSNPSTRQRKVKVEKEGKSVKESPIVAKHGQVSIMQHNHQNISPKQEANKSIVVQDAKIVQKPKVTKAKCKKIFQT
ncbi:hypothetical protein Cgig2_022173 [Carnegiea gigantea]|uniref:Uncharacterized protein n=1 Tax=Carnegiea gigantea TaxID=171969 RepID=A0A9Q1K027_9CARY|nr:hypothetical protein Cgig2_022173 [Carnegiea gigantea]